MSHSKEGGMQLHEPPLPPSHAVPFARVNIACHPLHVRKELCDAHKAPGKTLRYYRREILWHACHSSKTGPCVQAAEPLPPNRQQTPRGSVDAVLTVPRATATGFFVCISVFVWFTNQTTNNLVFVHFFPSLLPRLFPITNTENKSTRPNQNQNQTPNAT